METVRIGGVHEPFNLPWLCAIEDGAFTPHGVTVEFDTYAGGTGALVRGLVDGSIHLATVLTEGGATAVARGEPIRLHSAYVVSPLRWGIHVAAGSPLRSVEDLDGHRFAISRPGSGSQLMAYVLAEDHGWLIDDESFVEVGGVDGAVDALPNGDAEIFLWERFVTAPLVTAGIFDHIGDLPTPWPSFYTAARSDVLEEHRELLDTVVDTALDYADRLEADPEATVDQIVARYGMDPRDAHEWLAGVDWPSQVTVDLDVLDRVLGRMESLGRIPAGVGSADLVA